MIITISILQLIAFLMVFGIFHLPRNYQVNTRCFFDFIPLKSPRRVLLSSSFSVSGEKPSPMSIDESLSYKFQNLEFELIKAASGSDPKEFNLTLRGLNENGDSAVFHPVMGAFAHMVAFDKTANGFMPISILLVMKDLYWRVKPLEVT